MIAVTTSQVSDQTPHYLDLIAHITITLTNCNHAGNPSLKQKLLYHYHKLEVRQDLVQVVLHLHQQQSSNQDGLIHLGLTRNWNLLDLPLMKSVNVRLALDISGCIRRDILVYRGNVGGTIKDLGITLVQDV